jgi:hypothetical protein
MKLSQSSLTDALRSSVGAKKNPICRHFSAAGGMGAKTNEQSETQPVVTRYANATAAHVSPFRFLGNNVQAPRNMQGECNTQFVRSAP